MDSFRTNLYLILYIKKIPFQNGIDRQNPSRNNKTTIFRIYFSKYT